MQMDNQYPKEFFVKISEEEFRIGRLTVNRNFRGFSCEIDIVQKDSMKIWQHVEILQNLEDEHEAVELGVQGLTNFLRKS
jgi:hypothetical protein